MTLREISRKREHCLEKLEKKPSERKGKKGSGTKLIYKSRRKIKREHGVVAKFIKYLS